MQLLLGIADRDVLVQKGSVSSFLIYDSQSFPVVLGVEYPVPDGILRTFCDSSSLDFHQILQRSGLSRTGGQGLKYGIPCLLYTPFLGQGVPEWIADISKLLVMNDNGKYLFVAVRTGVGIFASAVYGADNFEGLVNLFLGEVCLKV